MLDTIQELKDKIIERATRQLQNNYGELSKNETLMLEDYFDDCITEIKKWRKLQNDKEFLSELYNYDIVKYIIRVFQEQGIEGQTSSNVGGDSKSYKLTPKQELQTNVKQRL